MIIEQITILILAIIGFTVSCHIYIHNQPDKKLVCLISDKDCGKVVNSKYNKTFGIKNEFAGMFYYCLIIIVFFISLFFPILHILFIILLLKIIISIAAFFSIYLTLLQFFLLKHYCEWCLASADVALTIFVLFVIK